MHDLIIKNGLIVDGTGAPGFRGDVAVDAGKITAVGEVSGTARRTIEAEGLLEHVTVLGQKLRDGLAADPRVTEVRGEGLLIGLDLAADVAAAVVGAAQTAGFIVNAPTPGRIRLAPPLVLTTDDANAFLAAWPAILDEAFAGAEA